MEVAIIEREAYKTLILRLDQISTDIEFCRKWIEASESKKKEGIYGKEWLTEDELSEFLGLSRRTLSRMRKKGELKYSLIGQNKIIYYRSDIDEYILNNTR